MQIVSVHFQKMNIFLVCGKKDWVRDVTKQGNWNMWQPEVTGWSSKNPVCRRCKCCQYFLALTLNRMSAFSCGAGVKTRSVMLARAKHKRDLEVRKSISFFKFFCYEPWGTISTQAGEALQHKRINVSKIFLSYCWKLDFSDLLSGMFFS